MSGMSAPSPELICLICAIVYLVLVPAEALPDRVAYHISSGNLANNRNEFTSHPSSQPSRNLSSQEPLSNLAGRVNGSNLQGRILSRFLSKRGQIGPCGIRWRRKKVPEASSSSLDKKPVNASSVRVRVLR
jgi:hypothetical protein